MATLNRIMLIGRLTDNPEPLRTLPNSGNTVVKFRFAVGKSKKNADGTWENDKNPLYLDCEAFGYADQTRGVKLPDLISQYCTKGSEIYIEGRLQYETWDDKNNPGQKRSKHKMVVESVQFLGDKKSGGGDDAGESRAAPQQQRSPAPAPARQAAPAPASNDDSEIPF